MSWRVKTRTVKACSRELVVDVVAESRSVDNSQSDANTVLLELCMAVSDTP